MGSSVVLVPRYTAFALEKNSHIITMAVLSLILASILLATTTLATPIVDRPGTAQDTRELDSIGGGNLLRSLDSIGGGNLLRQAPKSLDSIGGGNILRGASDHNVPRYHGYFEKRGYDPMRYY